MRLEDFAYASTADYYQLKDLGEPDGGSEFNLFSPLYPDSSHLQCALGVFCFALLFCCFYYGRAGIGLSVERVFD